MKSAHSLALTLSRDQIVAGAAIIQAASAAIILVLTGRLVTATNNQVTPVLAAMRSRRREIPMALRREGIIYHEDARLRRTCG